MTERMSGSKVGRALTVSFVAMVAFTALCGMAAGQYCGPYAGFSAMPVTVATPGGAIASASGVTACVGPGGAIASAGPVVAGASAQFPFAFAGPVAPVSPYYGPGLFF